MVLMEKKMLFWNGKKKKQDQLFLFDSKMFYLLLI